MSRQTDGHRLGAILLIASLLAVTLLAGASLIRTGRANLDRARAMLAGRADRPFQAMDDAAWDTGWRGLCAAPAPEADAAARAHMAGLAGDALSFAALAALDAGDFVAGRAALDELLARGPVGELPNAAAYRAALDLNWTLAAQNYSPTPAPRHARFWGTVFYLAAQQAFFAGKTDAAAELYRQGDLLFDTDGPLRGLALVDCLERAGRPVEAFDAYRRGLIDLAPDQALTHVARFDRLRLAGLAAWQAQDPANADVARWLAFYSAGQPAVSAALAPVETPLPDGRTVIGYDYRGEDIETGPFMTVDFTLRDAASAVSRERRTVFNQAPNGAFRWDGMPDGVRPFGWHGFVYGESAAVLRQHARREDGRGICQSTVTADHRLTLKSLPAPLAAGPYIQGATSIVGSGRDVTVGREWYGTGEGYNYSYLGAGRPAGDRTIQSGVWEGAPGAQAVGVWLLWNEGEEVCLAHSYLFAMPAR